MDCRIDACVAVPTSTTTAKTTAKHNTFNKKNTIHAQVKMMNGKTMVTKWRHHMNHQDYKRLAKVGYVTVGMSELDLDCQNAL